MKTNWDDSLRFKTDPLTIGAVAFILAWLAILFYIPIERSDWEQDTSSPDIPWVHKWELDRSLSVWLWNYEPVKTQPYVRQYRERIELEIWVPELVVFGVIATGISWLAWRKQQSSRQDKPAAAVMSQRTETPFTNPVPQSPRPSSHIASLPSEERICDFEGNPLPSVSEAISITRDGIEIGEWPETEVRARYQQGDLAGTDFYWMPGMTVWAELSTFIKPPHPVRLPSLPSTPVSLEKPQASMKTLYVGYFVGAILFSIMLAGDNLNPGFVIGTWGADVICAGFIWFIYKLIAKPKQPTSFTVFMAISAAVFVLMLIGKM